MSSYRSSRPHEAPFVGPSWWLAGAWLALATVAQATVVHYASVRGVVPSVVLVTVVWYAVRVDARRAAIYGAIAGLCEDALSTNTGGAWTISTTLAAVLAGTLSRGFFADSIPLVCAITAVATLARNLLFWSTMRVDGYPPGLAGMHAHEALLQALLNALTMAIVMLAMRRFGPERP